MNKNIQHWFGGMIILTSLTLILPPFNDLLPQDKGVEMRQAGYFPLSLKTSGDRITEPDRYSNPREMDPAEFLNLMVSEVFVELNETLYP